MSQPFALLFYGVRQVVRAGEIEDFETRKDKRLRMAAENKLDVFWGRFGDDGKYFLFIGKRFSLLGPEGESWVQISKSDLSELINETDRRLLSGGWSESGHLYAQFGQDI